VISFYYSNIRIFFGGFSADKIQRRIRLYNFFRRIFNGQKFGENSAIGGGLGSIYQSACDNMNTYKNFIKSRLQLKAEYLNSIIPPK